jgi:hypothetical protein
MVSTAASEGGGGGGAHSASRQPPRWSDSSEAAVETLLIEPDKHGLSNIISGSRPSGPRRGHGAGRAASTSCHALVDGAAAEKVHPAQRRDRVHVGHRPREGQREAKYNDSVVFFSHTGSAGASLIILRCNMVCPTVITSSTQVACEVVQTSPYYE